MNTLELFVGVINHEECADEACLEVRFSSVVASAAGVAVPNEFIFGVAFNTNTWGYNPIGLPGPYESLNVGTANVGGVGVPPSVGVDVEPGFAFWNTLTASSYSDGGVGGIGTFRRDGGWLNYSPAVQISAFSFATTADDCKNGGWQWSARADGSGFTNQGDCVSYTRNGK